ncbi:hypothetical protein BN159_3835 [Streptomyces davaonensis JCM 4913]|uniref:Uncharacterized protein n=1 Tax=Streptomyces davaonensis (strain DSM 101723 / JCM 4913 / KCC S-0913 / 768) TaxID=1214101 RepID=K4R675_STRDJ|nr:hypothetical protein [Streptomyces davaonensis]CCK28214.1 hypothetical protein BN159_3835 [Streptomyces davaonensis JCM 4913]
MESKWGWATGEGLLGMDDPVEVDAAFERGEPYLGTAVIGLAFNCSLEEASPRIVRAMQLPDPGQRGFAFTAAGAAARLNGALTPELYAALREEGPGGFAEHAIRDTLTFVPFRQLPPWFKRRKMVTRTRNKLESWWLRSGETVGNAWNTLRRRR